LGSPEGQKKLSQSIYIGFLDFLIDAGVDTEILPRDYEELKDER
jgi:hypothetical protein